MYKSFKDMTAWKKAMDIAETVHFLSDSLPKKEDYGFTSQIRRSALSISANLAEGFGRKHTLDKVNFYYNARGSLVETQSHLEYARRVGYICDSDSESLASNLDALHHEINKIINAMMQNGN